MFQFGTSGSGDYYLATRVNPYNSDYLDVVLEGVAAGWVAVGFSQNQLMVKMDLIFKQVFFFFFFFVKLNTNPVLACSIHVPTNYTNNPVFTNNLSNNYQ